ncbi:hypothetical protein BT96DRAFT_1006616 [Gymnopus androsaceus JB14]|uniref:Uncharacterized protein n=1 Tax=Gymnopus androsaceus JB14 TaxID=1447944 RepID=A0A6A4GKG9_9AGAR|nr:hypothetical protein BT96DRAFT_1006616 [Gymnopus androsaceus JB14]
MGAFTSDLGIAADLFQVGIPCWLVCPLQQQPLARIDRLVAPLDKEWSEKLRLCSLDTVDVSHKRPPYPLIYVGLSGSFKRYARMAIFIHCQFAVSLVGTFGSRESTTPSGSLILLGSVAHSSATSSSLSSAVQTKLSEMESLDVTLRDWIAPPPPKPKAPPKKKQKLANPSSYVPPPTEPCNRFLPIIHDSWPIRLHIWDIASQFLPDPALFVTPNNALKVSLLMWLHIRPALLWRLGLPNVKLFTNKQWRAMLEAADGFRTTPSQPLRAKMLMQLKSVLEDSRSVGIQIDADNIASVPALWNGVKVNLNASEQIDPSIVRQVIWELCEIKFCLEMLVLDRYMVPEPQGDTDEVEMLKEAWYEREFQVHCCWPGLPHLPKYTDPGFSSQRGTYRICYLKGLFDLVKAWPGVKPPELRRPFPQEDDHTALMEIEEILANYYLHSADRIIDYLFQIRIRYNKNLLIVHFLKFFVASNVCVMSEIESNLSLFAELPFHMLETAVDGASTADRIATMLETFTHTTMRLVQKEAFNAMHMCAN